MDLFSKEPAIQIEYHASPSMNGTFQCVRSPTESPLGTYFGNSAHVNHHHHQKTAYTFSCEEDNSVFTLFVRKTLYLNPLPMEPPIEYDVTVETTVTGLKLNRGPCDPTDRGNWNETEHRKVIGRTYYRAFPDQSPPTIGQWIQLRQNYEPSYIEAVKLEIIHNIHLMCPKMKAINFSTHMSIGELFVFFHEKLLRNMHQGAISVGESVLARYEGCWYEAIVVKSTEACVNEIARDGRQRQTVRYVTDKTTSNRGALPLRADLPSCCSFPYSHPWHRPRERER